MKKINIKSLDNMAVKRFLLSKSVIIMLLIFTVIMGITTPGFLSFSNMSNMLQDISIYGVAACGMTILIIAGEFDLSASSQYMLSMLFFIAMIERVGVFAAMLCTLLMGALIGMINGLLITKLNINNFVATLGTQLVMQGACLVFTGGKVLSTDDPFVVGLGNLKIMGLSSLTYIFAAVLIIVSFMLHRTTFGRNIYAVGGNRQAAEYAGINSDRIRILAYVCMGLLCAVSGMMFVSQMRAGAVRYGTDLTMSCVSATVIGGTSMSGGSGSAWKTLVGVLLINILYKALIFMGISSYVQDLVKGFVVIVVVVIDYFITGMDKKKSLAR